MLVSLKLSQRVIRDFHKDERLCVANTFSDILPLLVISFLIITHPWNTKHLKRYFH